MNRSSTVVAALLTLLIPVLAQAQNGAPARHAHGGLGFHTTQAPIGFRWWMTGQKVAFDAGVGFGSERASSAYPDEKVTNWTIDFGVPLVMRSWDRAHVMFRPGLLYHSQQVVVSSPPDPFDTDDETSFSLTAEIEGEVFLVDNVSFSASHGIQFTSLDPVGSGDSITSFSTIGRNFTQVGFHIYFFGTQ